MVLIFEYVRGNLYGIFKINLSAYECSFCAYTIFNAGDYFRNELKFLNIITRLKKWNKKFKFYFIIIEMRLALG